MASHLVDEHQAPCRLDLFLCHIWDRCSRTYFQELIALGLVVVNGRIEKKRYLVQPGDEIEVEFAQPKDSSIVPEPMDLDILYEDEDLLAINKPAGLVVHPGAGNWTGTFVHGLLYYCQTLQTVSSLRPGIVHRLDKETSGVLLAAKNIETQQKLVSAFAERLVEKVYLAITVGNPGNRMVENHIGRDPQHRQRMAIVQHGGKEARTSIETLHFNPPFATVLLFPETGRTHQLRVHLASLSCPILGDSVYGIARMNQKEGCSRHLLHAWLLAFPHPKTGTRCILQAPIPQDFLPYCGNLMAELERQRVLWTQSNKRSF